MKQPDIEKTFKKYADQISAEAEERTQLYFSNLKESFNTKFDEVNTKFDAVNTRIDSVIEVVTEIDRKVDLTFEKVGEIAVDVEVIKETVKDHPPSPKATAGQSDVRIQRLEKH